MPAAPHIASSAPFPAARCLSDYAIPSQDISAAEQVSLQDLTVPELSPSDPISNASSPSNSVPVTPLDPPPFAVPSDPLVDGKHQPDPRPFKPTTKSVSRGTVWRAKQALISLAKRNRRVSVDTGIISTGVQPFADNDMSESEMSDSNGQPEPEVEPRPSQVSRPPSRSKLRILQLL